MWLPLTGLKISHAACNLMSYPDSNSPNRNDFMNLEICVMCIRKYTECNMHVHLHLLVSVHLSYAVIFSYLKKLYIVLISLFIIMYAVKSKG
jgi:hypothetical protein